MSKSTTLQDPVSREQLQREIRETVREAQADARQAAEEALKQRPEVVVVPRLPPLPPTPGQTVVQYPTDFIPQRAETISIAFFVMFAAIIIGLPIMRALARRIERGAPPPTVPREVSDQLQQIVQSVDAIAIEVERISEAQRFTTKLLTDRERQATQLGGGQ